MKHIDITFDLETCATTPNAAVMQLAAVAWNRYAEKNPFSVSNGSAVATPSQSFSVSSGGNAANPPLMSFNMRVDLRTCVVDGFDFDQKTINWWAAQKHEAKKAVCDGYPHPIEEAFINFIEWICNVKKKTEADTICLWSQGMDFDGAILRNVCHKYDIELPLRYQQFRDCRTVILETATALSDHPEEILADSRKAYSIYEKMPDNYGTENQLHNAIYDCCRSAWNTYQALNILKK